MAVESDGAARMASTPEMDGEKRQSFKRCPIGLGLASRMGGVRGLAPYRHRRDANKCATRLRTFGDSLQFAEPPSRRGTQTQMRFEVKGVEPRLTQPNRHQVPRAGKQSAGVFSRWAYRDDCHEQLLPSRGRPHASGHRSHIPPHLQRRSLPQDAEWPRALRTHPKDRDIRAKQIHPEPAPSDAGGTLVPYRRIKPGAIGCADEVQEPVKCAPVTSLIDIYDSLVSDGQLSADAAQIEALPCLERVRQAVNTPPKPARKGLFSRLKPTAPDPLVGLYLWGGVGRGKSMLMDLLFEHIEAPKKRRIHFHPFMQEIHSALHEARKTGVDDAIRPVAEKVIEETRVLCLDEMQIKDITDAMIVGRLFEAFFDSGMAIVTTSNRVPDDLYKDGLNRALFLPFIDLIKTRMEVHELVSATDYRQDRLSGEQVYFSPICAESRATLNTIWSDLGNDSYTPLILKVKGRDVTIPRFHNGVGRASFFDLCGNALGPADYLEISHALRVLILDDIPRLSRDNFNEARRFVTLIDALYEAKVRLICSAADIPERLYLEGEGAFEFERTASRLREMQAAEWGQDSA